MAKRYYSQNNWLMRELAIPSIKGICCSFLILASVAAIFYFSPEIYFKLYGVNVAHPGRYHFVGVLICIINCWITYLAVSRYIRNKTKYVKARNSPEEQKRLEQEIEERKRVLNKTSD